MGRVPPLKLIIKSDKTVIVRFVYVTLSRKFPAIDKFERFLVNRYAKPIFKIKI